MIALLRNLTSLLFLFLVILFFNHSSIIKELKVTLDKSIPVRLLWIYIYKYKYIYLIYNKIYLTEII